jgi:hypothetical protein
MNNELFSPNLVPHEKVASDFPCSLLSPSYGGNGHTLVAIIWAQVLNSRLSKACYRGSGTLRNISEFPRLPAFRVGTSC